MGLAGDADWDAVATSVRRSGQDVFEGEGNTADWDAESTSVRRSGQGMEDAAVAGGGDLDDGEADIYERRVWECDLKPPIGVIDLSREPSHKDTWLDGHWADLGPPSRQRGLRREVRACLRIGSRFKPRQKRRVRAFLSGQSCVCKEFLIELK